MLPLPSIGMIHTSPSIRRILIEVPPDCPIHVDDVAWGAAGAALASFDRCGPEPGEILETVLIAANNRSMLRHYGIVPDEDDTRRQHARDDTAPVQKQHLRAWRTITPAALPRFAARRRIDPARLHAGNSAARKAFSPAPPEAKKASERLDEESRACAAVLHALRHVGVRTQVQAVRVQREPFDSRGARAESFAAGTRFPKEQLWHVELVFAEPIRGPLVIGDGRYLGLGIMAPRPRADVVDTSDESDEDRSEASGAAAEAIARQ